MLKWTVVVVALAALPVLATAQPAAPALPSLSTPDGLQAHLEEIIKLQRQQLQASAQAGQPLHPTLDNTRACYAADQAYSEGMRYKTPSGVNVVCQREANVIGITGTAANSRLAWVQQ